MPLNIIVKDDSKHYPSWRPGQDHGHFKSLNKKDSRKIDPLLSPEEQYSKEELRRIHNAIRHTNEKVNPADSNDNITGDDGVKRIIT